MTFSRRGILQGLAALASGVGASGAPAGKIGRRQLVNRHDVILNSAATESPLSVGNGEFAFTADVTGLQTLSAHYQQHGFPLCTQSQWGWHSFPNTTGKRVEDFQLTPFDAHGRQAGYAVSSKGQEELYNWLRENPHRLHLGRIAFARPTGPEITTEEITNIEQHLDLWNGSLLSRFRLNGAPVWVRTTAHPALDLIAVHVESRLLATEKLAITFEFPYGSARMEAADWLNTDRHRSTLLAKPLEAQVQRELDADRYFTRITWQGAAHFSERGAHRFLLLPDASTGQLNVTCHFSALPFHEPAPTAAQTEAASREYWPAFWTQGAALDLSGSVDARAPELERRVVLSQYLTAIHSAGSLPPQETGLVCNSWNGKFHLEMHWWHSAHFALWNRKHLLQKSLPWYKSILASAREKARMQGYLGARWPKMTAPDGRDSPSPIGPLLIWQQPHIIHMAELYYRAGASDAFLQEYRELVFASADFLASYAYYEEAKNRYVLGPPLIPAQECHPPRETWNPAFELEYVAETLKIANEWRRRTNLPPEPAWARVSDHLAELPVGDGLYLAHENASQTFTQRNYDHPSMLAAFGLLRGTKVDRATMRRTLDKVLEVWDWPRTWGWDYGMVAMTAARLNEPDIAVDALLMRTPKNSWQASGHTYQRKDLPVYLPSNGALLAAVAMMAGGWEGSGSKHAPGFPAKGWQVRAEGFLPLL